MIFIPTRGRYDLKTRHTYRTLPEKLRRKAMLVVRPDEYRLYRAWCPTSSLMILPKKVEGISATRQYILDAAITEKLPYCAMYDDDIRSFGYKPSMGSSKIVTDNTEAINIHQELTCWISGDGDGVGMCASSDRLAASRARTIYTDGTRLGQVLYLNTELAKSEGWRYDRVGLMQDVDMCMQVLTTGATVRRHNLYVHNNGPEDAPGGCSLHRTVKTRRDAYKKLEKLHPGFIVWSYDPEHGFKQRVAWKRLKEFGRQKRRR